MVIDNHTQDEKELTSSIFLSSVVIEIEFNFFKRWLLPMLKKLVFINIQGKLIRYEPLTNFI